MGSKERAQRDSEMAKRLKDDPYHNGKAVAKRKAQRHKEFMRKLLHGK